MLDTRALDLFKHKATAKVPESGPYELWFKTPKGKLEFFDFRDKYWKGGTATFSFGGNDPVLDIKAWVEKLRKDSGCPVDYSFFCGRPTFDYYREHGPLLWQTLISWKEPTFYEMMLEKRLSYSFYTEEQAREEATEWYQHLEQSLHFWED